MKVDTVVQLAPPFKHYKFNIPYGSYFVKDAPPSNKMNACFIRSVFPFLLNYLF